MEEITTLIATLILPVTVTAVPICSVVYALKGRERPIRAAVGTAQKVVASGAVWLALVLAGLYGVLDSLDRWGVGTFLALVLGPSAVLGTVLAVMTIWRERRGRSAVSDASSAMSQVTDEQGVRQ